MTKNKFNEDKQKTIQELEVNINRFPFMLPKWKGDKDIVLNVVKKKGAFIQNASKELRADKEVALEAVLNNGMALFFVSKELKDDVEVVYAALNGKRIDDNNNKDTKDLRARNQALKYASDRIKAMPDMVTKHILDDVGIFKDISLILKKNKSFVKDLIKKEPRVYMYVHKKLKKDKELALLIAGNKNIWTLVQEIDIVIKRDLDVARLALKTTPQTLSYFPEEIRNNRELVTEAIKKEGYLIKYIGHELLIDRNFILDIEKEINENSNKESEIYHNLQKFKRECYLIKEMDEIKTIDDRKIKRKI